MAPILFHPTAPRVGWRFEASIAHHAPEDSRPHFIPCCMEPS